MRKANVMNDTSQLKEGEGPSFHKFYYEIKL